MLAAVLAMSLTPTSADQVDAMLRARLAEKYPAVTRWEIKPFATQMPQLSGEARVVQLGARSAVQIGRRVYWYAVEGFAQAVSTTHTVNAGQPLDARDGQMAESNVLAANCDFVRDPAGLSGKRAKKTLHVSEVVCAAEVEPRPLVSRGQEIIVRYVGPNVSLTTNGVAQNDGVAGDSLLVLNPHSHDLFRAVVSGAREVTIHE